MKTKQAIKKILKQEHMTQKVLSEKVVMLDQVV